MCWLMWMCWRDRDMCRMWWHQTTYVLLLESCVRSSAHQCVHMTVHLMMCQVTLMWQAEGQVSLIVSMILTCLDSSLVCLANVSWTLLMSCTFPVPAFAFPASTVKAKAGMVHSISGWMRGVQLKLEIPWERVPYLSALEMCLQRGAIQIHVYLYLYLRLIRHHLL